jgi:pimeloyl-ACP methyl ester carboxylesterase
VILVGHSYGCMVIGGVAEKIPNRIRRLVYLDGYIPEDGKTAFDLLPGLEDHFKKRSLSSQGKEWLVQPLDPTAWGVTDIDDIAWIKRHLSPMPWHTHDQPIRINNPEAKKITKSYISCTEYKVSFYLSQFHFMAQKAKLRLGWDYHELKSGHEAMIIVPNELVQILETLT